MWFFEILSTEIQAVFINFSIQYFLAKKSSKIQAHREGDWII